MMVVQIMVALTLFLCLLFFADRWASSCTTEDRISIAERRRAHRIRRNQVRVERPRRIRRPPPEPLVAGRRPLQTVAADLRRLSRQLALVPSGSTIVRWRALWAAYDGVLVEAAEMLEVPHELEQQPAVGVARDVERVRVLAALEGAGLAVRA